jgi:uncharacterized protein YabE (DUF348 family)
LHRSIKFGLYGLVLAGLIGGTVAWANPGRSIALKVDGQLQKVSTSATTVGGVLKAAGLKIGSHDIVAPEPSAKIGNGGEVVVRRGHELHLVVNGKLKDVWVNAQSVDEALSQLGYDRHNFVSVSRSQRLDTGVTNLSVAAPKHLTIKADGKARSLITAGPTVSQALADAGVVLALGDRISAKAQSPITDNQVIRVQRASYKVSVEQVPVPFTVVQQKDTSAYAGTQSVVQAGQSGTNRVTYQLVFLDGVLVGKVAEWSTPLTKPVDQVTKVGTKPAPTFVTSVPAGSAQAIAAGMVAARGWDGNQFSCLVSLWNKESGWRTDAANPSGAYGIPQSLPGSKMASVGADWQTNPATQITWGLNYIAGVYGTPCAAWGHSQATNWY